MSQKEKIKNILADGAKHCSSEIIEKLYPIIDYRARIAGLKKEGVKIKSEPCGGRCGREHTANMFRYWIETQPVQAGLFELRKLHAYEI